jgi:hypothetical protein
MAGDWIKVRIDLVDDPAVIAIAARTGLDEDAVVGKLCRLWSWANRNTTDGYVGGIKAAWIDRYLNTPGFAEAMVEAGWLEATEDGPTTEDSITFPKFKRHNGDSAKSRALNMVGGLLNRRNPNGQVDIGD